MAAGQDARAVRFLIDASAIAAQARLGARADFATAPALHFAGVLFDCAVAGAPSRGIFGIQPHDGAAVRAISRTRSARAGSRLLRPSPIITTIVLRVSNPARRCPQLAEHAAEIRARVKIQRRRHYQMPLLEVGFRQMVHVDETADAAEASARARHQFEHQLRGVADRTRDVGEDYEIDVTRASRAEIEIDQRAAALHRGANRAAEIDSAGLRETQPASESNPEASNQRRERVARLVVVEVGEIVERHPLDRAESRNARGVDTGRRRFLARIRGALLFAAALLRLIAIGVFAFGVIAMRRRQFSLMVSLPTACDFSSRSFDSRAFARLLGLPRRLVVTRRRILAGTAAARGSRDLLTALIGMLSAIRARRGEKAAERFVEDRAVGFVLDQCRRQRLVHPRALEPNRRDRVHRIDRFRDRNSDARSRRRGDKTDQLIAKRGHLTTSRIYGAGRASRLSIRPWRGRLRA